MKRSVVIYDDDCGMCRRAKRIAQRLDWLRRFEFFPLQDPALSARFPQVTLEACLTEMKLVEPDGRTFGGVDALLRLFIRLPFLCPIAAVWMMPPLRFIAARFYQFIAANRHRLSSQCGLGRAKRFPPRQEY
jgi:predicted DCC family thiol-disulfide oxidoreductase YuxK